MEKRLTTFFMFAALLLAPFALVGCGEDIQVPDNPNNEEIENPIDGAATLFTGSKTALDGDGTRTSMDANRKFYWEAGDYIWVDTLKNGTFTGKSHSIELSNPTKAPSATFYYRQIILTERNYNLTYTGNNASIGTEVTIAAAQEQEGWNNAAHLGKSGDCGFATTEDRDANGKYKFVLKHQAAYLVFQPYRATAIADGWKLKSIEIISDNAIAGTYDFGMSGIVTSSARSTANSIKLTCKATQSSDFTIPQTTPSADKSCYVVIQPGQHKLTIRYEIQPTGSVVGTDSNGSTFFITKEFASRPYKVNGVSTIKHELDVQEFTIEYYNWDAPLGTTYVANSYAGNTVWMPTRASRSCKDMPNPNEGYWYVFNGDIRWDGETPWRFSGNSADIVVGGAWVKKKAAILADNTLTKCSHSSHGGNGPTFCSNHGPNGTDLCNTPNDTGISINYYNTSDSYRFGGKPDDTSNYFYLPAAGRYDYVYSSVSLTDVGRAGCYWTTAPASNTNGTSAQTVGFSKEPLWDHGQSTNFYAIENNGSDRRNGFVGGYRGDGTNWFQ